MIKPRAREHINTQTVRTTKVNGLTISSTDRASSHGRTVRGTRVFTKKARRRARADSHSLTEATMTAISIRMRSQVSVTTTGLMVSPTQATGKRTRWMERAYSSGETARSMMAIL